MPTSTIPTTARSHIYSCGAQKDNLVAFELSTHGPDPRDELAGKYIWSRESRRPDLHEVRVSRVNRKVTGRVGSAQRGFLKSHGSGRFGSGDFRISWVGSGQVNSFINIADRLGSGQ